MIRLRIASKAYCHWNIAYPGALQTSLGQYALEAHLSYITASVLQRTYPCQLLFSFQALNCDAFYTPGML